MHTRRQTDRPGASSRRCSFRPLMGALLFLLLGWGSAAPAHATGGTIDYGFTELTVYGGETLNLVDGASSSGRYVAVDVEGGTLNIYGGSLSASGWAVTLRSGAVNIYGGTVGTIDWSSQGSAGVLVSGGTLTIYGGSVSGTFAGIQSEGGSTTVSGGTVSGGDYGAYVLGGQVTCSGGSLAPNWKGILVKSGTVTISGGTISTLYNYGVETEGGTTTITGGSITATYGLHFAGGALSVYGCGLQLSDDPYNPQLTGTLQDGTPIATIAHGLSAGNLINNCAPPPCVPGLPQITCPSNLNVTADSGLCTASLNPGTATASDNCSPSLSVSGTRSDNLALTAPYPVGTTTITWSATNAAGTNSGSQTITITDGERPTITAPAGVTVAADPGQCTASSVSLGAPTTGDNCGVASVTNNAPSSFPVGSTLVTWTVTDIHGNQATATQTVTVQDTQKPTISCPGNMTVPATLASGAVVSFNVPVSDNCSGASVQTTPASGSTFPVGTTTVNCIATDAAGNPNTCSFTVTVQARADVAVTQTASPSPVVTGSQLTYTLTVNNAGPQTAQGVLLTDPLPAGTSFVSATRSASIGTLTSPKGSSSTVSWSIGTLASGQSVTLTAVVKVSAKAGSTLSNTATVSSSGLVDPNTANNSATVSTPVVAKR